jgi:hypothetical protein
MLSGRRSVWICVPRRFMIFGMTGPDLRTRIAALDVFTPPEERNAVFDAVIEDRDAELVDLLLDQLEGFLDERQCERLLELALDREASAELRARAAIALGPAMELWEMERDDPFPVEGEEFTFDPEVAERIHRSLLALVRDEEAPKLVRRRAFEAAVRSLSEEHDALIRRFWGDSDPEWRLTAMFAMGQNTRYEREVLAAIDDGSLDPVVRAEAFRSAAGLDLREVVGRAEAIAADAGESEDLRGGAMVAFARFAPLEAAELLERIAREERGELQDLARFLLEEIEEGSFDDW